MDIFEKQQRIETIRKLVKIRWFNASIIVVLGLVLKTDIMGGWGPGFEYLKIGALAIIAFGYNFVYWLFIRRPEEKISNWGLNIISLCQVVVDQIMYTIVFYFTGTVESVAFVLYYITILVASSIYKTKGVIFAGILAMFLNGGVIAAEYYRLITHITAYPGTVWFGNPYVTRGKIIGPTFYMAVAVLFSITLSDLFRKREARVKQQRDELSVKSQLLTVQTQELTKTKDYLHEALTKSDKARMEMEKAKTELEKANLELKGKLEEIEKYGKVTIGREVRMAELKGKIKKLEDTVKNLQDQINNKE